MFENLIQNTTKGQKIAILAFSQIIVVLIAFSLFSVSPPTIKQEVAVDNSLEKVPKEEQQIYAKQVYQLLAKAFPDAPVDQARVVVREGSYKEDTSSGVSSADFLVDVDEYKQTYRVRIEWSKTKELPDGVSVDCPKKQDMKYPETFCQGRYYNTDSIDLYVPYDFSEDGTSFQLMLDNKDKKVINAVIYACGDKAYENSVKKIDEYLNGTGIDFRVYSVKKIWSCNSD